MTITTTITARELRPGDVLVNSRGERLHAAFDVTVGPDAVVVYTAEADRLEGCPATLTYAPHLEFLVERRSYTSREAAERLGVSMRTLDRYDAESITHPIRLKRRSGSPRKYDAAEVDRLAREGVPA